jgi:HAD superfamily hydrolase (TIGR01509 family)
VASNSARRILNETLSRGAFDGSFSVCLSADEVRKPKPEPDVYFAAVAALGLQPENCLAFEDSETGAAAALSAGLKVIAVPSSPDQEPIAHAVCATLESGKLLQWVAGWP